ncbi:hypothetical protein RHSIM_Rhsim03G0002900 [Rhododendron simsii]|uniref:Phosphatidic acid phosphatase type 2/haloperoxidase domain-containing protein n=1 Tax=Rhododendron simsii TaxID=118357 RepID=A0A834H8F5_RHOSS|nr:hypothetical protein RHSIM_Rhsim03G0002900 [Rhododendron simsii]
MLDVASFLFGIGLWIVISSILNLTEKLRSLTQPWVSSLVVSGTPTILLIQSGHSKLARQMTLLMAFCDYLGNSVKYQLLARPSCPPVRRVTATKDERENAMEYGMPSSHTLNTVCLSQYARCCLCGANWLSSPAFFISDYAHFVAVAVTTFWAALSFLLLFAYPTPENPTPSFEYHSSFTGVAFGIVSTTIYLSHVIGVQQTYHLFHHENVARIFTPQLTLRAFAGRMLVGIPTILLVKFCTKALAKWNQPIVANSLGIPIKSTSYIPALILEIPITASNSSETLDDVKQSGYLQKLFVFSPQASFDVDTGIRFLQYAALAWSVVDLVPFLFSLLRL